MEKDIMRLVMPPSPTPGVGGCSVTPLDIAWLEEALPDGGLRLSGRFTVPPMPDGGRLWLRMDCVGCYATLEINGETIAEHTGGHTVWMCPVPGVQAGGVADITLTLRGGENTFSPYQTARILRGISLVTLPNAHLAALQVRADYAPGRGTLSLRCHVEAGARDGLRLDAALETRAGGTAGRWTLDTAGDAFTAEVPHALAWDAEHPDLYTLRLTLSRGGTALEEICVNIGFTAIARENPRILFNGAPLKLRGVNYREPVAGEARDMRAELTLLKDAGVNYLRSQYLPLSEGCLSLCDALGLHVEQCAPFCEVDQGIGSTQSTPAERKAYRGQFAEMLLAGMSHPCVTLWTLGDACTWGANFREGLRLARRLDGKRPVNFHFPMTIPEEDEQPDIWSVTNIDWRQDKDRHYDQMVIFHTHGANNEIGYATGEAPWDTRPVLHTAFAQPPSFNRDQLQRDAGIHEFWGESIDRLWRGIRDADGCLGGAVWAAVDEDGTFSPRLREHRWGILDAVGQPKPEYHHLRMAYTGAARADMPIAREEDCADGVSPSPYTIEEDAGVLTILNAHFRFVFDRHRGQLTEASASGVTLLTGGPMLQATRLTLPPWSGLVESARADAHGATVCLLGAYGPVCRVRFVLRIGTDGRLDTRAHILSLARPMPHAVKAGVGIDPGGLDELGIAYLAAPDCEAVSWARAAQWPAYPAGHIGRPQGTAYRGDGDDFTAMKHHVRGAALTFAGGGALDIPAQEALSIRLQEQDDPGFVYDDRDDRLVYEGLWREMDDACGNWADTESLSDAPDAALTFPFTGTGVRVFGPTDVLYGRGEASLDGGPPVRFDQQLALVDRPGASRGYEKRYGQLLFEAHGLANGPHTLRIRPLGEKTPGAQGCYVSIDRIVVDSPKVRRPVRLILNRDFNYTRLVRGNYMRPPVTLAAGDTLDAAIHLRAEKGGEKA